MDHRTPIKKGIDTTIELLKYNSHVKVLFTRADYSIKGKVLSVGACTFMGKSFRVERLQSEIKKVLGVY